MRKINKKTAIIGIFVIVFGLTAVSLAYRPSRVSIALDTKKAAETGNTQKASQASQSTAQADSSSNGAETDSGKNTSTGEPQKSASGSGSSGSGSSSDKPSTAPSVQNAPAESSPLVGIPMIKPVRLNKNDVPVIDPVLHTNVLGLVKGTGTVEMAAFKDPVKGDTLTNPVIVPDGKPNEAVYVSFYRIQELQKDFIGKHVTWYYSLSSTAGSYPSKYTDPESKFSTGGNSIYLIDYIYVN
ncbi:MAG: hypothetical protein Q8930_13070 [Bacillota bacterium]|nr:hypothetical protein [Bacillota bacterium]